MPFQGVRNTKAKLFRINRMYLGKGDHEMKVGLELSNEWLEQRTGKRIEHLAYLIHLKTWL